MTFLQREAQAIREQAAAKQREAQQKREAAEQQRRFAAAEQEDQMAQRLAERAFCETWQMAVGQN